MRIVYRISDNTELCLQDQEYSNGDGEYYRIESLDDVIIAISEGAVIAGYSQVKRKYLLNPAHILSQSEDSVQQDDDDRCT